METHSPGVAVSSGDHPVLVDQGTSAEMESVTLSSKDETAGLLHQVAKKMAYRSYQLVRSSMGVVRCSVLRDASTLRAGIKLATFQ